MIGFLGCERVLLAHVPFLSNTAQSFSAGLLSARSSPACIRAWKVVGKEVLVF